MLVAPPSHNLILYKYIERAERQRKKRNSQTFSREKANHFAKIG